MSSEVIYFSCSFSFFLYFRVALFCRKVSVLIRKQLTTLKAITTFAVTLEVIISCILKGFGGVVNNCWRNSQYLGLRKSIYNLHFFELSTQYSKLSMLMGNIDGVGNTDLKEKDCLDETAEDAPDYEYTVSPLLAPKIISILTYGK